MVVDHFSQGECIESSRPLLPEVANAGPSRGAHFPFRRRKVLIIRSTTTNEGLSRYHTCLTNHQNPATFPHTEASKTFHVTLNCSTISSPFLVIPLQWPAPENLPRVVLSRADPHISMGAYATPPGQPPQPRQGQPSPSNLQPHSVGCIFTCRVHACSPRADKANRSHMVEHTVRYAAPHPFAGARGYFDGEKRADASIVSSRCSYQFVKPISLRLKS